MYVMDEPSKWEDSLYLVKFAYNNGYHASLKMSLFESLYGRKCNTLISWDIPIDRVVIGPEMLKDMEEQIIKFKHKLRTARDRQKSYVDKGRIFKKF